jgi:F-type H+-transporting ATPase subunit delta
MNESQISVRYAKALFQLAEEKQILDRISRDMELLSAACRIKDFRYLLAVPSFQASRKRAIVESILKSHISESSMSMIALVISNKREIYLPDIARNFGDLYRRARGIRSASFVTATAVGEEVIDKIKKMIADAYKSEVDLTAKVDENLIGGFMLTVEDQRYNASVSGSLRKMKNQLLKTRTENR